MTITFTLKYSLIGGTLSMDKKSFAKELLMSSSPLKKILTPRDPSARPPKIHKNAETDTVTLDYTHASDIELDDNFESIFRSLKSKYRDKIKGQVTVRITFYDSHHIVLNLNSPNDQITYT